MKTNQKIILLSATFIIIVVAIILYMRKIKKHPILQRIQATADIEAQLYEAPRDKTKLNLIDKKIKIKAGQIVGYLYIIDANGYYTIRNNKGIYVPKESSKRIL
jgi:uncharacterized ion transporter superfamily protein YfcC